jgi:hypothetical protein
MDVEAVDRMSNLLEPFARLAERMGLWTTALTPAGGLRNVLARCGGPNKP